MHLATLMHSRLSMSLASCIVMSFVLSRSFKGDEIGQGGRNFVKGAAVPLRPPLNEAL